MNSPMQRAAVLIGVDRTGFLPHLTDAARGARRMEGWLADQGLTDDKIIILTDEGGRKVTADSILSAITAIIDSDDRPDQLIVYFAGHGISLNYSEYWLLSDAPQVAHAAVHVAASEAVARYCGIPHVVFISDACRTAGEGVRFQRVTGSVVFPNVANTLLEGAIDQFYACGLGQAAAEVREAAAPEKGFSALYTEALLQGLAGKGDIAVDWADEGGHVRPRPLKNFLSVEMKRRIERLGLQGKVNQVPDARITSDSAAWVSYLARRATAASTLASTRTHKSRIEVSEIPDASEFGGSAGTFDGHLGSPSSRFASALRSAMQEALLLDAPVQPHLYAPDRIASLGAQGEEIVGVFGREVTDVRPGRGPGESLALGLGSRWAEVVVTTRSGLVVQVPVVAGRRTVLTFHEGQLRGVQLATERDIELSAALKNRRKVREVARDALHAGTFEWSIEDIPLLLEYLDRDPYDLTLSLYAGYMLDGLRQPSAIDVLSDLVLRHWKHIPFDLALQKASTRAQATAGVSRTGSAHHLLPCFSRGWSKLAALEREPTDALGLRDFMLEGPWSTFSTGAIPLLRVLHIGGNAP